ncbi:MAG: hypothetical protein HQK51_18450 [Oligoflexia bacterium]|nr:hypothetical protein [Oligoflexia bacterium]
MLYINKKCFFIIMIIIANVFITNNICAREGTDKNQIPAIKSEGEKIAIIMSLAKKLPSDKIYYNWNDKKRVEERIREKIWSDEEIQKMLEKARVDPAKGVGWHSLAGKGIYLAEDPYSSSIYASEMFAKDGGALFEIKIEKGVPYIDLTDDKTIMELKKRGIEKEDLYKLNPPLLIKYDLVNDWWVIKTNQGVHFRQFSGYNMNADDMDRTIRNIKYRIPHAIFKKELQALPQRIQQESINDSIERNAWESCKTRDGGNSSLLHMLDVPLLYVGLSGNFWKMTEVDADLAKKNTFRIEYPQYNFRGANYYLSADSDLKGVCIHYAFKDVKNVQVGMSYGGYLASMFVDYASIMINSDGFPTKVMENTSIIVNITCVK